MQQSQNSEPGAVPPSAPIPPIAYPAGDPRSVVYYVETFLSIVEGGITGQVFAFWTGVIRTELKSITDESVRAEAMRLLQEVDKVGAWFAHEAQRPGEVLPLILSPIRKLMEYLKQAGQPASPGAALTVAGTAHPSAALPTQSPPPSVDGTRSSLR